MQLHHTIAVAQRRKWRASSDCLCVAGSVQYLGVEASEGLARAPLRRVKNEGKQLRGLSGPSAWTSASEDMQVNKVMGAGGRHEEGAE